MPKKIVGDYEYEYYNLPDNKFTCTRILLNTPGAEVERVGYWPDLPPEVKAELRQVQNLTAG